MSQIFLLIDNAQTCAVCESTGPGSEITWEIKVTDPRYESICGDRAIN